MESDGFVIDSNVSGHFLDGFKVPLSEGLHVVEEIDCTSSRRLLITTDRSTESKRQQFNAGSSKLGRS
eukprot:scaffold5037_cov180-Skeletonema_marinoi.AAC.1